MTVKEPQIPNDKPWLWGPWKPSAQAITRQRGQSASQLPHTPKWPHSLTPEPSQGGEETEGLKTSPGTTVKTPVKRHAWSWPANTLSFLSCIH